MRDKNFKKSHLKFRANFPDILRVLSIIIREITRQRNTIKCDFKKALARFKIRLK